MGENDRIHIVDNDESFRTTLAAILEEKGYVVVTGKNGKEAIKKSFNEFYNLAW